MNSEKQFQALIQRLNQSDYWQDKDFDWFREIFGVDEKSQKFICSLLKEYDFESDNLFKLWRLAEIVRRGDVLGKYG